MDFYYLGREDNKRIPQGESFKAIKTKDGYFPILDSYKPHQLVLTSQGYIRLGNRKIYDIPVFDRQEEHWQEYLDKWGEMCLYYSLSGGELYDYFREDEKYEFNCLLKYGVENYTDFVVQLKKLNEIQRKVIKEKYIPVDCDKGCIDRYTEKYITKPHYYFWGYVPFHVEIFSDTDNMREMYSRKRVEYYKSVHPEYNELLRLKQIGLEMCKTLIDKYEVPTVHQVPEWTKDLRDYEYYCEDVIDPVQCEVCDWARGLSQCLTLQRTNACMRCTSRMTRTQSSTRRRRCC